MKVLKKASLTLGLFSLILGGALHQNSVFAAPDKEDFLVHNKVTIVRNLETFNSLIATNSEIHSFVEKLNKKQFNTFKNSFETYGALNYTDDKGNNRIVLRSINYLVDAVKSGDLEFVKLVINNFVIPNINEIDDHGCGSPLWCAVRLADNKDIDNQTAKDIVDYLLSIGARPYYKEAKSYIPHLFKDISPSSPRMIFKEVFQKYGYYDII